MEVSINERLVQVRNKLKLSQKEMAEKLSVRQSYYSDVENSRRTLTNKFISKLQKEYNVSKDWIYTGMGYMFTPDKLENDIKKLPKIGVVRKKTFESTLSKEDQQLLTAMRELPELTEMLVKIIDLYSIESLENLSAIGAVWVPGVEFAEISKKKNDDAFELNMSCFIDSLSKYKKDIIGFKQTLVEFLKAIKPLDQVDKIRLPIE